MRLLVIFTLIAIELTSPSLCSVLNDFKDFLAVIPVEKIKGIVSDHLQNDAEFGDVVRYLQGPDWAALLAAANSKPEYVDFKTYMKNAGLDMGLINGIMDTYVKTLQPGTSPGHGGSVKSFLDEVEKIIPEDMLQTMLKDKMENSEDFQEFYKKVSSAECKELFEKMRALPEVQKIFNKLTDMGFKFQDFLKDIYTFLLWGTP